MCVGAEVMVGFGLERCCGTYWWKWWEMELAVHPAPPAVLSLVHLQTQTGEMIISTRLNIKNCYLTKVHFPSSLKQPNRVFKTLRYMSTCKHQTGVFITIIFIYTTLVDESAVVDKGSKRREKSEL